MALSRLVRPRRASPAGAPLLSEDGGPPAAGRRRMRWLALATLALAGAAVAAIAALDSGSPAPHAGGGGVPPGDTTATIERRTLVEHAQVDGTLGYAGAVDLYDRLAGTFTWLPAAGATIARGGTLFRIDNLPVVLMYGALPAYRALEQGVSDGPDVAELNENLIALGFDRYGAIGARAHFGAATAEAVKRWQGAEGLAQTGQVELGRVIFAPGERRVTAVHVALGEDPPPASEAEPATSGEGKDKPAVDEKPAAKTKSPGRHRKPAHRSPSKKHNPKEHASGTPGSSPAAGDSPGSKKAEPGKNEKSSPGKENPGSPAAGAPQVVLSTTDRRQIVQLQVKANQQQLAHVGERTTVTLPDGSVVAAHIASVGTVASESSENEKERGGGASPSSGSGENATISVTLALYRAVARLDKAPVSVELVKDVRHGVLAVPATALVAVAGGGYALQVLEGARRVELPVTPGMFAGGYVEVEGAGVREGLTVLEPQ